MIQGFDFLSGSSYSSFDHINERSRLMRCDGVLTGMCPVCGFQQPLDENGCCSKCGMYLGNYINKEMAEAKHDWWQAYAGGTLPKDIYSLEACGRMAVRCIAGVGMRSDLEQARYWSDCWARGKHINMQKAWDAVFEATQGQIAYNKDKFIERISDWEPWKNSKKAVKK